MRHISGERLWQSEGKTVRAVYVLIWSNVNDFNEHTEKLTGMKSIRKHSSPAALPASPSLLMPCSPLSAIFQQLQWVICVEFASATPQWDIFGEKATLLCWRAPLEGSRQLLSISDFRLVLSVCCGYPDIPGACPPSPTLGSTLIPILLARLRTFPSSGTQRTRQSSASYPNKWLMMSEFGNFHYFYSGPITFPLNAILHHCSRFNSFLFTLFHFLRTKWTNCCWPIMFLRLCGIMDSTLDF